mmetsp:Transcript_25347/g.40002  ORF Transcript_25347/g.40002 Transcript_25347/m.40002 type:complete len:632 (-) Transcript_25347:623-2518(-)
MNKLAQRFMKSLGLSSPKNGNRKGGRRKKGKGKSAEEDAPPPPAASDRSAASPPPPPVEAVKGRRFQIINESVEADETGEKKDYPKSPATRQLLSNALRNHFLFTEIGVEDLRDVVSAMAPAEKQAGEDVVRQGDDGLEFFVLEMGKCQVFIDDKKIRDYGPGGSFGELALMYNAKRAATVRAQTPCVLWSMDLRTFRRILATSSSSQMVERCEFLQSVEILHALKYEQISKLAGALAETAFRPGEYIIRQGERGDTFYIIQDGEVDVTQRKSAASDEEDVLATLRSGQYFGEMALLLDEPRMANCVSRGKVACLTLGRRQFTELLGPLQDLLTRNMQYRILQSVPLLSHLTAPQLDKCVDAMRVEIFQDGEKIVRQGEEGDKFYIINSGEVRVEALTKRGERKEFGRMGKQEYFGEQSLLKKEPRSADVVAVGEVACFVLQRSDFEDLLQGLQSLMEGEHRRRQSLRFKYLAHARGKQRGGGGGGGDGGGGGRALDDHNQSGVGGRAAASGCGCGCGSRSRERRTGHQGYHHHLAFGPISGVLFGVFRHPARADPQVRGGRGRPRRRPAHVLRRQAAPGGRAPGGPLRPGRRGCPVPRRRGAPHAGPGGGGEAAARRRRRRGEGGQEGVE